MTAELAQNPGLSMQLSRENLWAKDVCSGPRWPGEGLWNHNEMETECIRKDSKASYLGMWLPPPCFLFNLTFIKDLQFQKRPYVGCYREHYETVQKTWFCPQGPQILIEKTLMRLKCWQQFYVHTICCVLSSFTYILQNSYIGQVWFLPFYRWENEQLIRETVMWLKGKKHSKRTPHTPHG